MSIITGLEYKASLLCMRYLRFSPSMTACASNLLNGRLGSILLKNALSADGGKLRSDLRTYLLIFPVRSGIIDGLSSVLKFMTYLLGG